MAGLRARVLSRVVRPNGRAVVGIGDPQAMARMPFTPYGLTLRPVDEVRAALKKAGLEVVAERRLADLTIPHNLLVAQRR